MQTTRSSTLPASRKAATVAGKAIKPRAAPAAAAAAARVISVLAVNKPVADERNDRSRRDFLATGEFLVFASSQRSRRSRSKGLRGGSRLRPEMNENKSSSSEEKAGIDCWRDKGLACGAVETSFSLSVSLLLSLSIVLSLPPSLFVRDKERVSRI